MPSLEGVVYEDMGIAAGTCYTLNYSSHIPFTHLGHKHNGLELVLVLSGTS